MKFKLTVIGCDNDDAFGDDRIILEDEQLGELKIREIKLNSFSEIFELLNKSDTVQFEESNWGRYDGEITIICGNLF